jgi:hypothetical protein
MQLRSVAVEVITVGAHYFGLDRKIIRLRSKRVNSADLAKAQELLNDLLKG